MKDMLLSFNGIPHVERKVYGSTFLNKISVLFTFTHIDWENSFDDISLFVSKEGGVLVSGENGEGSIVYKFDDVVITVSASGVFVSIPSNEYKNFNDTGNLWEHVGNLLECMAVQPIALVLSKYNRIPFTTHFAEDKRDRLFSLVLSEKLVESSNEKHECYKLSDNQCGVFYCNYGLDTKDNQDSLFLNLMLLPGSYSLNDIKMHVFAANEVLFDCWHWCMSPRMLDILDK